MTETLTRNMIHSYAALGEKEILQKWDYKPAPLGPSDVEIRISHCGVCHTDIDLIDNAWRKGASYPLIPGHEIIGTVVDMGFSVSSLKMGMRVGIGWQRSSCSHCEWCMKGEQNLCALQEATCVGHPGGFAERIRIDERFVFPIPEKMSSAEAAPLFCAGATVFSPLLQHKVSPGSRIGVVGIGGLGHLALQFARAFGCEVTAFSSSPNKEKEAKQLGAHHFVSSTDDLSLRNISRSFDFILCTVFESLDWEKFLHALRPKGTLCFVGGQAKHLSFSFPSLLIGRKQVSASNIASPPDIKEMLRIAAIHNIKAIVEVFPISQVNEAIEKVRKGDIRYRAVLSRIFSMYRKLYDVPSRKILNQHFLR